MNSLTSSPPENVEQARRLEASRARRTERAIDRGAPRVEQRVAHDADPAPGLRVRLLGPLVIERNGQPLPLPSSRKARGLLAYLALSSHAVARSHLCELLWDLPNDPRGELRWCLSKLRALLDEPGRARVLAEGETLRLNLEGAHVDAHAWQAAVHAGLGSFDTDRLRALSSLARGEFLEGLEIERSAPWSGWLLAQRRHWRATRVALLEHLAGALEPGSDEALAALEAWLALAPFDRRAHESMLDALARRGRLHEGDAHLAVAARAFEAQAQDWTPLGRLWRAAKQRHGAAPGATRATRTTDAPHATAATRATGHAQVPHSTDMPQPPPIVHPTTATPHGAASPAPVAQVGVIVVAPRDALVIDATAHAPTRRASLAVMPFADPSRRVAARGGIADGLAFDVITRLSKLRSLFVIAPGTTFALDARGVGAEEAARTLDVDYVASGSVRRSGGRIRVAVQLSQTRSARIVWADVLEAAPGDGDDAFGMLDVIGNRIVASIAGQIEHAERQRAILKTPQSLDAWEAHHRGLWHVMRFNRDDNAQARRFFERALELDPGFSRPYAGLSFTHFQDAFLGWHDRSTAIECAYRSASQGLDVDALDPAAHWSLGRALWLRGEADASLRELDTSIEISPNFAHGHYTRGFVHSQSGDPLQAIASADHSRALSPYDPLLFGMLGARAMALMRLGRHDDAVKAALEAADRPNAHVHILAVAAHALGLAGRDADARRFVARIREAVPGYRSADFIASFHFADDAQDMMRGVSQRIGLG